LLRLDWLIAAWLGQDPLEQLLGAARFDHLLRLVVVDLGEREPLGEADRAHETGELAEAPLDDLTLVGFEVFPRPAREPVGFANSGGVVFVDESAEEVGRRSWAVAFFGVGSRPLGGRRWSARCGLCPL
jgi:hypothetical protein